MVQAGSRRFLQGVLLAVLVAAGHDLALPGLLRGGSGAADQLKVRVDEMRQPCEAPKCSAPGQYCQPYSLLASCGFTGDLLQKPAQAELSRLQWLQGRFARLLTTS